MNPDSTLQLRFPQPAQIGGDRQVCGLSGRRAKLEWAGEQDRGFSEFIRGKQLSDSSEHFVDAKGRTLYAAPRRFDLATVLVVTTAYSLLFAGMKVFHLGSLAFAYVAGLFALVAIAQSLFASWDNPRKVAFFFRNDPRQVSILVGMAYYLFLTWPLFVFQFGHILQIVRYILQIDFSIVRFGLALVGTFLPGVLLGYLSGVLVGGVFLVADKLRGLSNQGLCLGAALESASQSPWDEDDEG